MKRAAIGSVLGKDLENEINRYLAEGWDLHTVRASSSHTHESQTYLVVFLKEVR